MDGLLREFFRSAMPNPWPAPPTRNRHVLPLTLSTSWKRRARSVLALAASIAILAVTLGLLSGKFGGRAPALFPHEYDSGMKTQDHKDSTQHRQVRSANE
jgi:hypothetical protein